MPLPYGWWCTFETLGRSSRSALCCHIVDNGLGLGVGFEREGSGKLASLVVFRRTAAVFSFKWVMRESFFTDLGASYWYKAVALLDKRLAWAFSCSHAARSGKV